MIYLNNSELELINSSYVPITKGSTVYYGGNQMWFTKNRKLSNDYLIHHYGCGTIATSDLFLYMGNKGKAYSTTITDGILNKADNVSYTDYMSYVRKINTYYTKTKPVIAVLGPRIAYAFNSYAKKYQIKLKAKWALSLSYYEMLEYIEEMLFYDIPVIISIGPNTPKLWGKKGISFFLREVLNEIDDNTKKDYSLINPILYKFNSVRNNINSHYVTVTGIYRMIKSNSKEIIMLRISSWGKLYYVDYNQYREYIDTIGGTFTSSLLYIK